jgi:hypothetical protein
MELYLHIPDTTLCLGAYVQKQNYASYHALNGAANVDAPPM